MMIVNDGDQKRTLLIVTEAALENPHADPLSAEDKIRVNGVFRTYQSLSPHLAAFFNVRFLTPFDYPGAERPPLRAMFNRDTPFCLPQQPSIRLVMPSTGDMDQRMGQIRPDHVHIATEGPLGIKSMIFCKRRDIPVSTAFHTNWQQYVTEDGFHIPGVPRKLGGWAAKTLLTIFHKCANATMAATPDLRGELTAWGLKPQNIHIISRGIDTATFRALPDEARPVVEPYILNVGRLAPGKGVDKFCELETDGLKKVVVGTGPLEEKLRDQYPDVHFAGFAQGAALAKYYSGAALFVLPSDTETFGMTVMESLACGTPVIALNRGGHQPILNAREGLGIMRENLQAAFDEAIRNPEQFLPKAEMSAYMHETRSWRKEAENFRDMVTAARAYL